MLKIVFVGIKHCGKSTFGKSLAKRWDCVFFDSDTELEKAFYQPISFSTAARRALTQKISIARASSSGEGKLGAIRM